jgi:hypothetical protein
VSVPTVFIVGAEKGGTGKTTTSRVLLDYLASKNVLARAFDTEHPSGSLQRFHPEVTRVVDLTETSDQMVVFDTLATTETKVTLLDLRAGTLMSTLELLETIGFLDGVQSGSVNCTLFHVLGANAASMAEIESIKPYLGAVDYVAVRNRINNATFFANEKGLVGAMKGIEDRPTIDLPNLKEMAFEAVEAAGASFRDFAADKDADGKPAGNSYVLRGIVKAWLSGCTSELDRIGVLGRIAIDERRKARR